MTEKQLAFINPLNGTTFRCVESQLLKTPGKDPWGNPLSAAHKRASGQEERA